MEADQDNPQPAQTASSSMMPPPKTSGSPVLLYVAILVVIIILVIGYFVLGNSGPKNTTTTSTLVNSSTSSSTSVNISSSSVNSSSTLQSSSTTSISVNNTSNSISLQNISTVYCIGGFQIEGYAPQTIGSVYYASLSHNSISSWNTTTSYPKENDGSIRNISMSSCSTYNGYVYCVGGGTPFVNSTYYAKLSSSGIGQWMPTTPYLYPIDGQVCTASSGYLYCIGGGNDTKVRSNVTKYAAISSSGIGQWHSSSIYPNNTIPWYCVSYNNYVYCITGTDYYGNVYQSYYAGLSSNGVGKWSQTIDYPIGFIPGACTAYNNYVYCIGGVNSTGDLTNSTYYGQLTNSGIAGWVKTTSYPVPTYYQTCIAYGGDMYCTGGAINGPKEGNFQSENDTQSTYMAPITNYGLGPWTKEANYPSDISSAPSCFV